jgi:D-lactate dehydrogenase
MSQNLLTSLLSTRAIDRYRISSDASHFLLIPDAVAVPESVDEIAELFAHATQKGTSITFRSGGTSLSGQAVSNAILIDSRKNFREIEVLENGLLVRVQPGAAVRSVNARLARFGRKLGPDPASEIACTIGGVIANNSSGMACGITQNTYKTLKSATVVLANGAIINTADADSETQLATKAPELFKSLSEIKEKIDSRTDLVDRIRKQYLIKNTMGYGLNSFVDFDSIMEIFLHILVGSEGTLGFIAEAIFETVPLLPNAATTLAIFADLVSATEALNSLIATNPTTIELMDAASLRAGHVDVSGLEVVDHAAFLIEYQAIDNEELKAMVKIAQGVIDSLHTVNTPILNSDKQVRDSLWHIRKGLYATVAGARRSGTTALLEDIAVPVENLADTCLKLQDLFKRYGYEDAVIFGHAKDGNIHFLINEDFTDALKVERYAMFTEDMVKLVLSHQGSLKAEHGTGRMMAPFVRRQYGDELYEIMQDIKRAFDPKTVLNPGVLLTSDEKAHLKNIKFNPPIEKVADNCVECGYCEPICPSKDLTTTPRQRIVIRRAIESARIIGDTKLANELHSEAIYEVEDTCAVDGMCAISCPLSINTGSLVKELRTENTSFLMRRFWTNASQNWSNRTNQIGSLLSIAHKIPTSLLLPINVALRRIFGHNLIPLWSKDLPSGGVKRNAMHAEEADFVFFISCLGTMFSSQTANSLKSLATKAGIQYRVPDGIDDLCCGTPWRSKGFTRGYENMVEKTYAILESTSDHGRLPIVCENSSCSEGLIQAVRTKAANKLRIIDSVDYVAQELLPRLKITRKLDSVVLHPTCSSTALGSNANLQTLAESLAFKVTVPEAWGCCAFAGDRGILHPELTASATAAEVSSLINQEFDAYLSTNQTCEIGMSRATGKEYQHILCQLDQLVAGEGFEPS